MSTEFADTLDVRDIPPRDRPLLIFSRFNALQPGQSLHLINDPGALFPVAIAADGAGSFA